MKSSRGNWSLAQIFVELTALGLGTLSNSLAYLFLFILFFENSDWLARSLTTPAPALHQPSKFIKAFCQSLRVYAELGMSPRRHA